MKSETNVEFDTTSLCLRAPTPAEFDWIVEQASALAMRRADHPRECEDHAATMVVDYLLTPEPWRSICLVAERDGEHVGAGILMGKTTQQAELTVFFVNPVARGREIGECLLNACMDFAMGPRYESLSCTTTLFPECAEPFLTRFGFREQESGSEWLRQL